MYFSFREQHYPHAIISMKLMKFTVLYTATNKGGKQLLERVLKITYISLHILMRMRRSHGQFYANTLQKTA